MGTRRIKEAAADDVNKRPQRKKSDRLVKTNTNFGEVLRAQRRMTEDVNARASQHIIGVPISRSVYNGLGGEQYSPAKMRNRKPARDALKVIQIGGAGEMGIGKNCIAFEINDDIIIIDLGLLFPHAADYPGINYIVPDMSYLEARKDKVRAIAITHAHLDHIGATRHILPKFPNVPVYATPFTAGMIERQVVEETEEEYDPSMIQVVNPDLHENIKVSDNFSIEFIRVNHSVPDSAAIVIRTPVGNIFHSGDWRFEENPVDGKKFDIERVTEVASKEGFAMMLNESTNVESEGTHQHGELDIKESIGQVLDKFPNSRVIFSSFSSQIMRIQCAIDEAAKRGRKVAVAGFSMINNLEIALKGGIVKIPKGTLIKIEDLVKLPDSQFMLICTGSQGEMNAVLNRMATGAHKHIKIKNTDVIVFSSNPIPGNEPFVVRTIDGLMREGSEVLQNKKTARYGIGPLHLSGHAYYDDHVKLINAVHPKYYIPIYGEYHMLANNAELAHKSCGIPKENIFVLDDGDVIELSDKGARRVARVQVGGVMYDSEGTIVSEAVLKDRIHMSNEGIFTIVATVEKGTGRLLSSPDIISRGFIYLRDSEELMRTVRNYIRQKISQAYKTKRVIFDDLKHEIKDDISLLLYDQTGRTPIVIPVINEVGGREQQDKRTDSDDKYRPKFSPRPRNNAEDLRNVSLNYIPRANFQASRREQFARRAAEHDRQGKPNTNRRQQSARPARNISFKKTPQGPTAGKLWKE